MHQSISAALILLGNRGAFAHVVSPGGRNYIAARGLGIGVTRGDLRAFDRIVFERKMSLSGRMRPLSKPKLPAEGNNRCINLRGEHYIVFFRERKQGEFAQQKAENCSFVQKRRNFVTRLLVV